MLNIRNSTADAMKDMPETVQVDQSIKIVNDSIEHLSMMI